VIESRRGNRPSSKDRGGAFSRASWFRFDDDKEARLVEQPREKKTPFGAGIASLKHEEEKKKKPNELYVTTKTKARRIAQQSRRRSLTGRKKTRRGSWSEM